MTMPLEDARAVRWWAKETGVSTNDVLRLAVWAYLLPVRGNMK